jgi:hypothetical protein
LNTGNIEVRESVIVEVVGFQGTGNANVQNNLFVNTDVAFNGWSNFANNHVSGSCGTAALGGRVKNKFTGNFVSDAGRTKGCVGVDVGIGMIMPYGGSSNARNLTLWNNRIAIVSEGDVSDTASDLRLVDNGIALDWRSHITERCLIRMGKAKPNTYCEECYGGTLQDRMYLATNVLTDSLVAGCRDDFSSRGQTNALGLKCGAPAVGMEYFGGKITKTHFMNFRMGGPVIRQSSGRADSGGVRDLRLSMLNFTNVPKTSYFRCGACVHVCMHVCVSSLLCSQLFRLSLRGFG